MYYILLSIFFPILCGIFLLIRKEMEHRKNLLIVVGIIFLATFALTILALCLSGNEMFTLFNLSGRLPVLFKIDEISIVFVSMTLIIYICVGIYSFEYMKHEEKEKRYYGFYLIVLGILIALCFSGNLITFYLFYELLTINSVPLVIHNRSREAIMAGLKYIFYSLCGAYMVLFGLYFIERYGNTLTFSAGGVISASAMSEHGEILLVLAMLMLIGFGVKAGMFPMHAWLSTAHPAAPGPASAVLSAVIVKAGILAIVRVVYYIYGVSFLRGNLGTDSVDGSFPRYGFYGIYAGIQRAGFKKRLAYSTVSQLSYILFGLAVMDAGSVTGGLLHVLSHGFIKAVLFLCAGAVIYMTGKTRVEQMRGIGKEMPFMMWCFTIASLGLIGIPPTGGFLSKWYLAQGALSSGICGFDWIGPVVLLISALLTAGYLLPITIQGFFPGENYDYGALQKKEPSLFMTIPVLILTVLSVFIGLFPEWLLNYLSQIIEKII